MADITSEPVAGFISESVADLPRNQHSGPRLGILGRPRGHQRCRAGPPYRRRRHRRRDAGRALRA